MKGSSPLARGLRKNAFIRDSRVRIIPARAGFTARHTKTQGRQPDHPRSRGVYAYGDGEFGRGQGSSPLARGLPTLHLMVKGCTRIIPARAGFT